MSIMHGVATAREFRPAGLQQLRGEIGLTDMSNLFIALALSSAFASTAYTQTVFRAPLTIRAQWTAPQYGDLRVKGQALMLEGTTLDLEVGIINPFPSGIVGAEANWLSLTSMTVKTGRLHDPNRVLAGNVECDLTAPIIEQGTSTTDVGLLLETNGSLSYRCTFDSSRHELSPGQYTIELRWSDAALDNAAFKNVADSSESVVIELEVRKVSTTADELDRQVALAGQAIHRKQFAAALNILNAIIKADADNGFVHVLVGDAYRGLGRCVEARAAWRRSADSFESPNATSAALRRRSRQERTTNAQRWRQLADEMRCP